MSKKDRVLAVLALLLVVLAFLMPSNIYRLTPLAFLSIPVEGLLGVALLLFLPPRARKITAIVLGVTLGLLAIMKLADMGFYASLDRQFDPVGDWPFIAAGVEFVKESFGTAASVGAVIVAIVLAIAFLVLMILAVLRLAPILTDHRVAAARTIGVLGVVWIVSAALGLHVTKGVPVAAHPYYDRIHQVQAGFNDIGRFDEELATDQYRHVPAQDLLTALRGKDVVITFVESYGRVAVEDPALAPQVGAVLEAGNTRLRAAGFDSRSAFLTSPTAGGGSWLAHDTLLSGLWVNSQQRHEALLKSDRMTLNTAFKRAGWRTVSVMPALNGPWPEGAFFGDDKIYGAQDLGYQGPRFAFSQMPDQYAMSVFQRSEIAPHNRAPVMAEIPLVSSHAPWNPIPSMIGWDQVGDGSIYHADPGSDDMPESVFQHDRAEVRADYGKSIQYSLSMLISYVETYGDDKLVLVFLGDHQPAPIVAGEGATRDVPITIVAKDHTLLDRISSWGWQEGLKPAPNAPVWRMDAFRDRFLTAFK